MSDVQSESEGAMHPHDRTSLHQNTLGAATCRRKGFSAGELGSGGSASAETGIGTRPSVSFPLWISICSRPPFEIVNGFLFRVRSAFAPLKSASLRNRVSMDTIHEDRAEPELEPTEGKLALALAAGKPGHGKWT
jgi:hypothetical protein